MLVEADRRRSMFDMAAALFILLNLEGELGVAVTT